MANKKTFRVQDESVNAYGMVVLTTGIKMERFMKNPVMLYMHDTGKLIGKWEDVVVNGKEITATPVFNTKNAFAAERAQEVEDGFLNGTSLGLIPIKWESGESIGLGSDVLVLAESELKEITICPIPVNGNMVCLYDNEGNALSEDRIKTIKLSFNPSQKQNSNMEITKLAALALGLKATATEDEVLLAVQNTANENKTLKAEKEKWEKEKGEAQTKLVTDTVQLAIDSKKIEEGQRADYTDLLTANFATGKKILDGIKPAEVAPVNLAMEVNKNQPVPQKNGEVNLADKSTWKLSDYMKNDYEGLQKMKTEKKDDYIKLCVASGIPADQITWA